MKIKNSIQEEWLSAIERNEMDRIINKMKKGKEKSFFEILKKEKHPAK